MRRTVERADPKCGRPAVCREETIPTTDKFDLVDSGNSLAKIYLSSRATEPVRFAAEELQRYIHAMSGAELAIVRGTWPGHQLIVGQRAPSVGPDRRRAAKGIPTPPGSSADADGYQIQATRSRISISGAGAPAVLYGVYDLLERLGCGFCVPGDDTIPRRRTIRVSLCDFTVLPAFSYRAQLDFPLRSLRQSVTLIDWLAKNRLNWYHAAPNARGLPVRRRLADSPPPPGPPWWTGSPQRWTERRDAVTSELKKRGLHLQFGGHTMATWMPEQDYFAKHPDWFALINGKRGGTNRDRNKALCVTNAQMRKELVRNMGLFLDENPEVEIVDLWHPDSDDFCHCDRCLGGIPADAGDEFVGMAYVKSFVDAVNKVAENLQKSHPGVKVSPLANYSRSTNWFLPHECQVNDSVLVGLAYFPPLRDSYRPLAGEPRSPGNQRLLAIDLSWSAKARHTYLYEYYNSWATPFIHPQARTAGQDLKLLIKLGFTGVSSDMWGWTPVNLYVYARLMWNPELEADDLVKDFCDRYYGKAAGAMCDYWMGLEQVVYGTPGYLSGEQVKAVLKKHRRRNIAILKEARDSITDPVIQERIARCLLPWQSLGDKKKALGPDPSHSQERARWWAVPAFAEDRFESD